MSSCRMRVFIFFIFEHVYKMYMKKVKSNFVIPEIFFQLFFKVGENFFLNFAKNTTFSSKRKSFLKYKFASYNFVSLFL
jgi:hypothetical protein